MFEYHGWAVIHDDTYEDNATNLRRIIGELQQLADDFNDGSGMTDIRNINGAWYVTFAGHPNHRHDCVFGWFKWLAEHAPGSYGLLYVRDDESPEFGNAFQVCCLRRGQVEVRIDPFMSPCIPVVEDPNDVGR